VALSGSLIALAPAAAADASPSPSPTGSTSPSPTGSTSPSPSPTASDEPDDPVPLPAPTGLRISPTNPSSVYTGTTSDGCGGQSTWYYLQPGDSSLTADFGTASSVEFHLQDVTARGTDVLGGPGTISTATGVATFPLDQSKLLDGHAYTWYAQARDAQGDYGWASIECGLRIDHTAPTIAPLDPAPLNAAHLSDWGVATLYNDPVQSDGRTSQGCLEYRLDASSTWVRPRCASSGTTWTSVAFDRAGMNTVHLRARDEAGNVSPEIETTVFVYPGPTLPGDLWGPKAQWQLSRESGGAETLSNFPLTATGGVSYRDDTITPSVAHLDGTGSLGTAGLPVVDTAKDFTITTWARVPTGSGGAVISQDGDRATGFVLWASPWDKLWHFSMGSSDTDGSVFDDTVVRTGNSAVAYDTWQQLTVTYSGTGGFMQLYVDGKPAASGYHAPGKAWTAKGALRIGNFRDKGRQTFPFTGDVFDVAAHTRTASYGEHDGNYYAGTQTSRCLDADGTANGTRAQLWYCAGDARQAFSIDRPDGTVRHAGKCLDVTGNAVNNGAQIELWDCNGGGNQIWEPRVDGSLYNPQSGRCLDIPFGSDAYGTKLQLWDCNGGFNQRWTPARGPFTMISLQ